MTAIQKVLLIDDDPISNMITVKMMAGFKFARKIDTCLSAKEGLEYLQTHQWPDIILLDINMPVMDGWEFLSHYRRLFPGAAGQIRLFMYSSSVYSEDTNRVAQYPEITAYIVKPLLEDKMNEIREKYFSSHELRQS